MSVFVAEENRERNVRLVDYDHPDNNILHVTTEWAHRSTVFRNRADVIFLINGIPVACAETKGAGKPNGLGIGVQQIRRYHSETPEMLTSAQVFEVTQLLDFLYGVTWNTDRKALFNWRDEHPGDYEAKVKAFFDPQRFLRVLRDYIVFVTENDQLGKKILRQHQTRAVEKVIRRIHDPAKRRGLVWHTQGSGKTLTMITIASKMLREAEDEKPTVLMLVDRNELEAQLDRNLEACGVGTVKVARSKKDLRRLLGSDYRGLVVSMIHKFDGVPPNLNTRSNVVALVDEAHRTTSGDLGNFLMAALPNATYIGFTGTPIDRISKGQGTFKVFGCEDETGYLDKYSIAESIEDETTVRLHYAHGPSELFADRGLLEKEFWGLTETEGISDPEELDAILDRAVELKEMMKSPQRVDRIAQLVSEHLTENVEPMGFKAFVVAVDLEACALYKQALDRYLPADYSEVVYSSVHNDEGIVKQYQIGEEREKEVRRHFIAGDRLPKVLIVTQKLLTGFDAPILYAMYLDKPMRDHVLLQTIARVNRPYEDELGTVKPCGLVFDFVGIFEHLERALAFDSDVVTSVIKNLDVLRDLFERKMQEADERYLPLARATGDKGKESAVLAFEDKDEREAFYQFFRQLQSLYDILTPDALLRPYVADFRALAALYGLVRQNYDRGAYVDIELTRKTKELLRKHTEGLNFELPGAVHELGPDEIRRLRDSGESPTTKVLNLNKVLAGQVEDKGAQSPFLIPIGERAAALMQLWEDRQLSTQQALEEFLRLAQECVDASEERQGMEVDENTFAIYTALKPAVAEVTPENAVDIDALFQQHPDYQWNEQERSGLRAALYKVLLPLVGKDKFIDVTNTLLRLKRV
jgi:type I restriction enzyme R subunit